MKIVMIAALAAAQLLAAAAPAQAAEDPNSETATQPQEKLAGALLREEVDHKLRNGQAPELRLAGAPQSTRATAARRDEPRKKRKSTGDKVLTGAAVVLGLGALAVGGLLVALFVG
jgi:hypothetical protein